MSWQPFVLCVCVCVPSYVACLFIPLIFCWVSHYKLIRHDVRKPSSFWQLNTKHFNLHKVELALYITLAVFCFLWTFSLINSSHVETRTLFYFCISLLCKFQIPKQHIGCISLKNTCSSYFKYFKHWGSIPMHWTAVGLSTLRDVTFWSPLFSSLPVLPSPSQQSYPPLFICSTSQERKCV